ncbi:hypothetical protein KBY99_00345 [Cyanobium sp. Maggiore-St4-Cus]|uniref:hypothetical protein n=1 Tax=Cyanobium sp. Maggiore-St4-Cus TaxID=2823717 RepID=UPI0020CC0493|nr:hypothetical protein [Cyanobium sp. Maggiore-St4-Cus]MCP9787430.1 hypothetical protein [Cyanobium sp. Maggiore-St4-Cus]
MSLLFISSLFLQVKKRLQRHHIQYPPHHHLQLVSQYCSLDNAIADAIEWIGLFSEPDHPTSWIGVEVSSINGDWRTCRMPGPLLCPLPR